MQYCTKSLLLLATAGLLTLVGCSKPSELGLSLVELNPSDIIYTDTFGLNFSTVTTTPLPAAERSRWLCGAYIDPIFGKTTTSIYTNFRLTSTNATFPNATLDSIVLAIAYDSVGHYGNDLNNPGVQSWEVYRLEETIEPDQEYFTDATFSTGALLGSASFTPRPFDSVEVMGQSESAQLRIRLDNQLGLELIDPDSAIYENNAQFKEFFKGVYIRPAGSNNTAIYRFLPNSPRTKLVMYYTDSAGTARSFDFLTDSDAESVLNIVHDYSGTEILDNKQTDSVVYVQGMNGPGAKIEFPGISSLGKVIVNKAELVFYVAGNAQREYPIPDQLFALEQTSTGEYILVSDIVSALDRNSNDPFEQFGGLLLSNGSTSYFRMNLSEFMQRVVDGEVQDNAIYVQPASVTDTERMLLSNERADLKAKLYFTYTKTN